jgi:uncharacterized protein (DUF433 family)
MDSAAMTLDPGAYFDITPAGDVRFKGHRIGLEHVLAYYRQGYTAEGIAHEFPGLSLEAIYAAITLYLHNRDRMDADLDREIAERARDYTAWRTTESPLVARLRRQAVANRL